MKFVSHRLAFLLEIFVNGPFIFLYSLQMTGRVPKFIPGQLLNTIIATGAQLVPFILTCVVAIYFWLSDDIEDFFRRHIFSLIILMPLYLTFGDREFAFWLCSAHFLSSVLSLYEQKKPQDFDPFVLDQDKSFFQKLKFTPAQIVLFTFFGLILIGTFLLALPVSAPEGKRVALIDALFMTTSATCVTGLATISVKNDLSLFGQMVLLMLVQVGGLGFMTLSSSLAILMGRSMRMKERLLMQDLLEVNGIGDLYQMVADIIRYTFYIELWGAIILTIGFSLDGMDLSTAIYYGFFHSISAFCNAGFAMWDNNLENYATNPIIHGTIAMLIILGGLGFIVLRELREMVMGQKNFMRITLHSKIVLVTTFLLILGGALFIFFGEFLNALDGYNLFEKTQIAFFQSVTLRTAGFNTISLTSLHPFTAYAFTLFMFVGASPGSTGGGIKTTTFAILIQSIKSTLTGSKNVTIFDRKVPNQVVVKAIGLTFVSIMVCSFFVLIMMKLEPNQSLLTLLFEVVSAFGTVGLSLGATTQLSVPGKLAISILMYIGRVGPLTMVLAVGESMNKTGNYEYPDGRVMIG